MVSAKGFVTSSATVVLDRVLQNDSLRHIARRYAEKAAYNASMRLEMPGPIKAAEFVGKRNLIYAIDRALDRGAISSRVREKILKNLFGKIMLPKKDVQEAFYEKYKIYPPGFITISPTAHCNLFCEGCYANSSNRDKIHLDFDVFCRILEEKQRDWDSNFTVISGGEPLMWRSRGKTLLDLLRKYQDQFFMMYTNGTLIDERMADAIAEVGNLTPAVSLEGFEEATDKRRGKGTFSKILKAFDNLRRVGVPFGVSLTATRENVEAMMSREFIDFCFEQQGAIYAWFFQYMPIGRHFTLEHLVTPEQRLAMYKAQWDYMQNKKLFFVDFWNGGPISQGCFSGGRRGGYFYINWNGDVTPCVFFPYSTHNVYKIYENGGTINDVLLTGLFQDLRQWQKEYGYSEVGKSDPDKIGNWLAPCPIRDHHKAAWEMIQRNNARGIDLPAQEAVLDEKYHAMLEEYGERVSQLTQGEWERDYLRN